jgi:hypothetical protein
MPETTSVPTPITTPDGPPTITPVFPPITQPVDPPITQRTGPLVFRPIQLGRIRNLRPPASRGDPIARRMGRSAGRLGSVAY